MITGMWCLKLWFNQLPIRLTGVQPAPHNPRLYTTSTNSYRGTPVLFPPSTCCFLFFSFFDCPECSCFLSVSFLPFWSCRFWTLYYILTHTHPSLSLSHLLSHRTPPSSFYSPHCLDDIVSLGPFGNVTAVILSACAYIVYTHPKCTKDVRNTVYSGWFSLTYIILKMPGE